MRRPAVSTTSPASISSPAGVIASFGTGISRGSITPSRSSVSSTGMTRIRSVGERAAGWNAHRLAGPKRTRRSVAHTNLADDLPFTDSVRGTHGKAVHGRTGVRGILVVGCGVLRQDPAE